MRIFDFNPNKSNSKRALISLLAIFSLGAAVLIGSTLAANINLNSGGPVEFGQGVAQATACDSNIVITPFSSFVNASGGGAFKFTSFSVSDIDSQSCDGKVLTIKAYKNGVSAPLTLYTTDNGSPTDYSEVKVLVTNNGDYTFVDAGLQSDDIITNNSSKFTVNLSTAGPPPSTAQALASDVDRITVESNQSSNSSRWGIAWESNQVFVKNVNGIFIGSTITSNTFPSGFRVINIVPGNLSGDIADIVGGILLCYATNQLGNYPDGPAIPCQRFALNDSGYILTLSGGPYFNPLEELLTIVNS